MRFSRKIVANKQSPLIVQPEPSVVAQGTVDKVVVVDVCPVVLEIVAVAVQGLAANFLNRFLCTPLIDYPFLSCFGLSSKFIQKRLDRLKPIQSVKWVLLKRGVSYKNYRNNIKHLAFW